MKNALILLSRIKDYCGRRGTKTVRARDRREKKEKKTGFYEDSRAVVYMNSQWCDTIHNTYEREKTPTWREEELGTKFHQLLGEESALFKGMATSRHSQLLFGHTLKSTRSTLKGPNVYKRIINEKTNVGKH